LVRSGCSTVAVLADSKKSLLEVLEEILTGTGFVSMGAEPLRYKLSSLSQRSPKAIVQEPNFAVEFSHDVSRTDLRTAFGADSTCFCAFFRSADTARYSHSIRGRSEPGLIVSFACALGIRAAGRLWHFYISM
jgi:hypothetical protein